MVMLQIESYHNNHLSINLIFKRLCVKAGKDSLPFANIVFITIEQPKLIRNIRV